MTQRLEAEQQLALYGDLGEIMGAMKNLAQVELHRVGRLAGAQLSCRQQIRQAVDIYELNHPLPEQPARTDRQIYVVIGSERGFCANFNDAPKAQVAALLERVHRPDILLVGNRLATACGDIPSGLRVIAGANTALDVVGVLDALIEQLDQVMLPAGPHHVTIVYPTSTGMRSEVVLPIPRSPQALSGARPARLNLPADFVYTTLARHWLYHSILTAFYLSLQAENHMRLGQMEGAIRHLDESSDNLKVQINRLRQEAIVEEIEVIFAKPTDSWLPGGNAT